MRKITFLLAIYLCSICAYAQTQGSLEAFNKEGNEIGACPLKRTSVKADVSGFLARVTVTQEFENNFAEPIEAVYTFPLSQMAAVDDMTMLIGDRRISGKIMRREDARKVYEAAKNEGKTASLLDQERPNIFTQAVANILPNEKITIEISYVETLKFDDGSYEFVFPMTVAPRYVPDSVDEEDAEKISPPVAPARAGHDISIEVNLNAGVPVEEIRSNSHEIQSLNLSANSAKISLKNEKTIPNKDFVLRYDVIGKRMEDAVLVNKGAKGGFFSLILSPPERLSSEDVTPKEIVFVLDTSGSMSGFPIEKAKEAMKLALDGLYPNDTFNLITFAGDTHVLFDKPVPATQANLDKARKFLESREGSGGTEMMKAIKTALAPSGSQEHLRIVCFMTDGEVGDDMEIIAEVKKHPKARVFSFGIGDSVNRFLLDNIAKEGRGEAEYVLLEEDGSRAAKRFHERIRNPYLTDVSIDWGTLPIAEIYPRRIPDLFGAKPVVVFGRYARAGNGVIKLKGKIGGQNFERDIAVNLPESENANEVLATLWARTKVDELMSQSWDADEEAASPKPRIRNAIIKLGLDYRLMTQFTSFVAVEEKIVTNSKGKKVRVPVYAPSGTVFEEGGEGSGIGYGSGSGSGSGNVSGSGMAQMVNSGANVTNLTLTTKSPQITISGGNANIPPPAPTPVPKKLSGGVLNGKATSLPKPAYPAAARVVNASGAVNVQITTDESGNVISVSAVSGHPLLRAAAEQAARNAKFAPTLLSGQPVKVTGVIVYNFTDPENSANINVSVGETRPQTEEEKLPIPIAPEVVRQQRLAEKLHVWIYALVERLRKSETAPTANEARFVEDEKAKVQIIFSVKTPEAMEKLRVLGFEILSEKYKNAVIGKIDIKKMESLAEIAEVRYVLPESK